MSASPTILLDAHVHLHQSFDPADFLDSARANFRSAARRLDGSGTVGCLWLTDTSDDRSFRRLSRGVGNLRLEHWSLSRTAEPISLLATHESGDTLILLAGRQISTRERFEVLALGSEQDFPHDQSLEDTIAAVRTSGAIAVIPWGFGKWWFRRRRLLGATLVSSAAAGLFIGDNGGRPRVLPRSSLFELAASRGIYNLPGSDPLPLGWEIRKPGSLGCVLEGSVDLSRPGEDILNLLLSVRAQPLLFGETESLPGFARSQMALRLSSRRTMAEKIDG